MKVHYIGQSGKKLYPDFQKQKSLAENLKAFIITYKSRWYLTFCRFIHILLLESQRNNRELYKEEVKIFKKL